MILPSLIKGRTRSLNGQKATGVVRITTEDCSPLALGVSSLSSLWMARSSPPMPILDNRVAYLEHRADKDCTRA